MSDYKFEFDSDSDLSYGSWVCPACGSSFFGGGPAIHRSGCSKTDYSGLIYRYTQEQVNTYRSHVHEQGIFSYGPIDQNLHEYLLNLDIAEGVLQVGDLILASERYMQYLTSIGVREDQIDLWRIRINQFFKFNSQLELNQWSNE